jgi:hypothetical protein
MDDVIDTALAGETPWGGRITDLPGVGERELERGTLERNREQNLWPWIAGGLGAASLVLLIVVVAR